MTTFPHSATFSYYSPILWYLLIFFIFYFMFSLFFLFLEAKPGLALRLAVTPSWRGTSAAAANNLSLTLYRYTWPCLSVFNPVSPSHSYWLSFYCDKLYVFSFIL
ncbi:hypothetical protein CHARACLAT_024171 [Characodon lateralis]|uniref:ATP synthase F0 subunit 8 n=1 Tax=Characodon lateralis TaxID=208331 RepID=A0ABU7DDP9_9TELE|nr:hypothetical protein [Characodon lateralis]